MRQQSRFFSPIILCFGVSLLDCACVLVCLSDRGTTFFSFLPFFCDFVFRFSVCLCFFFSFYSVSLSLSLCCCCFYSILLDCFVSSLSHFINSVNEEESRHKRPSLSQNPKKYVSIKLHPCQQTNWTITKALKQTSSLGWVSLYFSYICISYPLGQFMLFESTLTTSPRCEM